MRRTRWTLLAVVMAIGLALVVSPALAAKGGGKKGKKNKSTTSTPYTPTPATPETPATPATPETPKTSVELPEAAAKAVKDAFPNATLGDVKAEEENGVKMFEVKLKVGEAETEVGVTADGVITVVETAVDLKDVPEAAAAAIKKAAEGAELKKVEKEEIRAEAKDGKVAKLDKAKIVFDAQLAKGDQCGKIKVADDGKVVEELQWQAAEKKEETPK